MYGYIGAPLQGKSFRKAVSAVMDYLEHSYLIIDNYHLNNDNLISKIALLQCLTHKIVNCVSALWIVLSSRKSREGNVWAVLCLLVASCLPVRSLIPL